jgi:DnaJ-class molecular chaperone
MTCWEILGLPDTASVEDVKRAYRTKAPSVHPDVGGTPQEFMHLNLAYKQALAIAELPAICSNCKGLGTIPRVSGWAVINEHCHVCKGSGQVERE